MQHVMHHVVRRDSSTIKFSLPELKLHLFLALFQWLKPLTYEAGKEATETPWRRASENATY